MELMYGLSKRGKKTLIYHNFEYSQERVNSNGTVSWRCTKFQKCKCKARVLTDRTRVIRDRQSDHTHSGNVESSLARKAMGEMKDKMSEPTVTPNTALTAILPTITAGVMMALPKRPTIARALRRHQQKINATNNGGQAMPQKPNNVLFDVPEMFRNIVLYDSGPSDNRLIIMGCGALLDGLARAEVWLADGTFKVVPGIFFQLYSIHFSFGAGINPAAVYCLLTEKTSDTYTRMLRELKILIPAAAPRKIMVDFERAAMNAFELAFPGSTITGCYFHLCQSLLRKVNELGMKTQYETNDILRGYVRCLPAIAFVPLEDVEDAFDILADDKPNEEHIDELLSYFEHSYVRGRRLRGRNAGHGPPAFPKDKWNQNEAAVGGIARTNNVCEGWHHGLQALFHGLHPTLWTFMTGVQRDILKQTTAFLHGVTGLDHPSKKTYRALNDRVQRAVAAYGRAEILVFLRAMAHLSHS
jgi:hypothetical protein